MTAEVFTSVKLNTDDQFEIQNTLSIDAPHRWVHVDTNYKHTRPGQHPVDLSFVDAVKAARALIEAAALTYNRSQEDPAQSWDLLSALSAVDAEVSDLRDSLLLDLKPKEA